MARAQLATGTLFALLAGLMWGLVFVAPLLLPDYPAALQSFARDLAFGLIALPLAWWDRAQLARLTREDWIEALKLSVVGNLLYYLFLAAAIQRGAACRVDPLRDVEYFALADQPLAQIRRDWGLEAVESPA